MNLNTFCKLSLVHARLMHSSKKRVHQLDILMVSGELMHSAETAICSSIFYTTHHVQG